MTQSTSIAKSNSILTPDFTDIVDALTYAIQSNRFASLISETGSASSYVLNEPLTNKLLTQSVRAYNGNRWRVVHTYPGLQPVNNLAKALSQPGQLFLPKEMTASAEPNIRKLLHEQQNAISQVYQQAAFAAQNPFNLLIVIHHFEDLFRHKQLFTNKSEDVQYVSLLLNAIHNSAVPVYVILDIKAPFLYETSKFRGLSTLINQSKVLLSPIQKSWIIQQLGKLGEGSDNFSPESLSNLVDDIKKDQHNESLLLRTNFMLNELQSSESDQENIKNAYLGKGGITNGISKKLNQIYQQLSEREQHICQLIIRLIVGKDSAGKLVRKPITFSNVRSFLSTHFEEKITQHEITQVFQAFDLTSFSLFRKDNNSTFSIVDLSSDKLLKLWDEISLWVSDEHFYINIYKRLVADTLSYKDGAGDGELYTGMKLEAAINWQNSANNSLLWVQQHDDTSLPEETWAKQYANSLEAVQAFLRKSNKEHLLLIQREEETRAFKIKRANKRARNAYMMLGVSVFCLLFALNEFRKAKNRRDNMELMNTLSDFSDARIIEDKLDYAKINSIRYAINQDSIDDNRALFNRFYQDSLLVMDERRYLNTSSLPEDDINILNTMSTIFKNYRLKKEDGKEKDKFIQIAKEELLFDTTYNKKENIEKDTIDKLKENPFYFKALTEILDLKIATNSNRAIELVRKDTTSIYDVTSNSEVEQEFAYIKEEGIVTICVFDLAQCVELEDIVAANDYGGRSVAYSSDGKYIFAATLSGNVYRWNRNSNTTRFSNDIRDSSPEIKASFKKIASIGKNIIFVSFTSIQGKARVIAHTTSGIYSIHPETGNYDKLVEEKVPISSMCIQPEGNFILYSTADYSKLVELRPKKLGRTILEIKHPNVRITASAINNLNPDKTATVAFGSDQGKYWQTRIDFSSRSFQEVNLNNTSFFGKPKTKHSASITRLVFNPEKSSNILASAGLDGKVRLIDTEDDKEKDDILIENGRDIWSLAFKNPYEIIACENRVLRIWISDQTRLIEVLQ